MRSAAAKLISEFRHSDFASSAGPLIVIVSLFIVISAGLIFYILKLLHSENSESTASSAEVHHEIAKDSRRDLRIRRGRMYEFFRSFLVSQDSGPSPHPEALAMQISRLEEENVNTREMYSRAVARIDQLKDELRLANEKAYEAIALSESAEQQRDRKSVV